MFWPVALLFILLIILFLLERVKKVLFMCQKVACRYMNQLILGQDFQT